MEEVKNAVLKLQEEKNNSGVQVLIFNEKAQLCSNPDYANYVSEVLNPIKEKALTKAVLEVAAIIAYKQPITRLEIENFRGVNSDYAINALVENNLIEIVGRKDAVGKPLLFGTTDNFLKKFSLTSIDELPDYEELINRIAVLHEKQDDGNSLFNFRDTEDEITKEEAILKGDKIIEDIENSIDTEKLKQEILNDKSAFESLLDDEDEIDKLLNS
jgi:segregation and condensation protein B